MDCLGNLTHACDDSCPVKWSHTWSHSWSRWLYEHFVTIILVMYSDYSWCKPKLPVYCLTYRCTNIPLYRKTCLLIACYFSLKPLVCCLLCDMPQHFLVLILKSSKKSDSFYMFVLTSFFMTSGMFQHNKKCNTDWSIVEF